MPEPRVLRLHTTPWSAAPWSATPWSELAPLKVLTLFDANFVSLPCHSQSLTPLMLDDVSLGDEISCPVAFPSLTCLSLYDVSGLKPNMDVPCLCTYHEGGCTVSEPFYTPLPSLVEYGVYGLSACDSDPAEWHPIFPNILRLSIRADRSVFFSFLASFANQPHSLPELHIICIWVPNRDINFLEEDQGAMKTLIRARSEARQMDVALFVETEPPFHISLHSFRQSLLDDPVYTDTHLRNRIFITDLNVIHLAHYGRHTRVVINIMFISFPLVA
jgi:hypothetical protein